MSMLNIICGELLNLINVSWIYFLKKINVLKNAISMLEKRLRIWKDVFIPTPYTAPNPNYIPKDGIFIVTKCPAKVMPHLKWKLECHGYRNGGGGGGGIAGWFQTDLLYLSHTCNVRPVLLWLFSKIVILTKTYHFRFLINDKFLLEQSVVYVNIGFPQPTDDRQNCLQVASIPQFGYCI